MYQDYERHKKLYDGVDIPQFLTEKPVNKIQPYGKSRLLNQRKVVQNKKKQQNRPKQQYKRGNKQHIANMKKQFQNYNEYGKKLHGNSSGILKNMESLIVPVLLIAAAAMGLKKYLGNLDTKDLERNVYGGDVSPSGRSTGKTSAKGLQLIKNKEGFKDKAYQDERGIWTIGYGHTGGVKPGDTITREDAEKLLQQDVVKFENAVNKAVKVPISQNQFDALVSLCYNIGEGAFAESTVVKKLNAGDYKGAQEAFMMWNKVKVKGKMQESEGLTKRRREEANLFGSDISEDNKLKAPEINPKVENSYQTVDVKDIGKATQVNNNGYRYNENSNITSHTKMQSGENNLYDSTKGNMGTFNGVEITSGIGKRNVAKGSSFHRGLDLKYSKGTPVKAFCSGKVTYASVMAGFGRCVIVDDKNGYRHIYGHLSKISVNTGIKVKKGQLLGYSGGSSTVNGKLVDDYFAPHLHYGIWQPNGKSDKKDYIDPRTYRYPQDDGNVPKTETPKHETPKGNPITPATQKPTTQNPKTVQPTKKPQQTQIKPQNKATTIQNKNTQKPKQNGIKLDQPGLRNRSLPNTKK